MNFNETQVISDELTAMRSSVSHIQFKYLIRDYSSRTNFPPCVRTDLQSPGETNMANQKTYRIEEIPRDEINLSEDELLIPVSHFYKDVFSAFGIPFYIKIKQGEQFAAVKERLQKKLGVSDKEWEKVCHFKMTRSHLSWDFNFVIFFAV